MVAPGLPSVPPTPRRPLATPEPARKVAAGPQLLGTRRPSPAPRGMPQGVVAAWACCLLGVLALAWVPASLWPAAGLPAWPAVSLGLVAVLISWGRGGALLRAVGGIAGLLAALAGGAQLAALWAAAGSISYM